MTELAEVLAEEREIMDAWAPAYDTMMVSNALVYQVERAAFARWVGERVRAAGQDPATLSLLDAGCGNGQLTEHLAHEGFAVTGFDLSPRMLDQGRARGIPQSEWVEGTIEDPPFAAASFDVVVAAWVIHHMYDAHAWRRLVEHVLRPGGWFFVLEFDGAVAGEQQTGTRRARRGAGDVVRAALKLKNRRSLAARVGPEVRFNRAHAFLDEEGLRDVVPGGAGYEIERVQRSAVLGTLLPVLVDDSALDRRLARWAQAADRRLGAPGVFQWLAGRRPPA